MPPDLMGLAAGTALVGVLLAAIALSFAWCRPATEDGYVYAWWPVRESVFISGTDGKALWIVTERRLWLCEARRVVTAYGEVYYVKVAR